MSEERGQGRLAPVHFTGERSELFGLLFRGYLLMVPTLGIYRFWVTTWKRRFYWQNTVIDGDPLEYTGHAMQLLIGFLFALAFFLPIYIVFFYLSTQSPEITIIGYAAVGVTLWFLSGYAIYRGRDFRLSRTLWRGIRFNQHGNGWGYAWRRFGWSILMVLTLGLVYPFMASNLWKYRYNHTWYGDRQFGWTGSWKTIAGPYYKLYGAVVALAFATIFVSASGGLVEVDGVLMPGWPAWAMGSAAALVLWLGVYYFRSREATRMFSQVRVGDATISVKVRARSLFGQFLLYCLSLTGALVVFGMFIGVIVGSLFGNALMNPGAEGAEFARILQSGWGTIAWLIACYLALLASFALLGEVFLGYGYWMLVARGAVISNADSLKSARATGEDLALVGEGLADALNVGAY
ncbi:MAG: YjgN family protein [Devosia sp.]